MGDALTFPDVEVPLSRLDYSDEQAWSKVVHSDQPPLPSGETPGTLNDLRSFLRLWVCVLTIDETDER
ncbi:hypothetical protein [Rhodococcus erythropolis]|uniref:hypothetical protein n=1 Tax=Rhodococcus erythropolis TaxID=1833 RepID=UPI00294B2AC2|nr:hypothetical protein [Rhodococcus erythropolis]